MADDATPSGGLEQQRAYLLRYAMHHLRDASLAEDAVQETLVAALRGGKQFAGRSQWRTWLTAILKNKIVDQVRRDRRYVALERVDADGTDEAADSPDPFTPSGDWAQTPGRWEMPETALETTQFWRVYEQCCRRMPERHALVFSMREVMEMTSEEICKELGISASNLHVILFRARLRLRTCMSKNWFEGNHYG